MGLDLLEMVEESRIKEKIVGAINATFIALIPKCNKPQSFVDFKKISFCNLVYKTISKVIANRLKPTVI